MPPFTFCILVFDFIVCVHFQFFLYRAGIGLVESLTSLVLPVVGGCIVCAGVVAGVLDDAAR